jgi:hypothetical protein
MIVDLKAEFTEKLSDLQESITELRRVVRRKRVRMLCLQV